MILRISILLVILNFIAFPQKVSSYQIKGNKVFSESEYRQWGAFRVGIPFSDSLNIKSTTSILGELSSRGYFYGNVTFNKTSILKDSSIEVTAFIEEGTPSYINKINIDGFQGDTIIINNAFEMLQGSAYNSFALEEVFNSLLDYYENNGYPFARFEVKSLTLNKDSVENEYTVDINIALSKDSLSRINDIIISGNTSTKDYVIVRELRIDKDEYYSKNKIDEFPKKLNRLRFFEPVENPSFFFDTKGKGVLQINIKEKQTNNFDAVIGYMPPPSEKEKGYLTGLVNISLRNLFGTGRAVAFRWQQFNRYSQELELKYLEPWAAGLPFNIKVSLFQRKQDTTYVQRKYEAGIDYLATENVSATLFIAGESIIPTIPVVPKFTVYNSGSFVTGLSLDIDTRDDPYSPQSGLKFSTSYSLSRKKIYGPEEYLTETSKRSFNLQRITVDFLFFTSIFKRQVIALGAHGAELTGDNFEVSDLYRLGGTLTLRGYRENQFTGNRIAFTNLEYRFLLSKRAYAFLFFDAGYYFRKAEPDKSILETSGFKTGYGAGLNLETGLGVLTVSYALAKGEGFSDGKIHFGIINEF